MRAVVLLEPAPADHLKQMFSRLHKQSSLDITLQFHSNLKQFCNIIIVSCVIMEVGMYGR